MIDVLFIALVVGAAIIGWQRGAAVSLVAAIAFVLAGVPVAALAAAAGSAVPPIAGFALGGLAGLVVVAVRAAAIEQRIDTMFPHAVRRVDRGIGAAVNIAVALALGWFVAAVAMVLPGSAGPVTAVRSSAVLEALVEELPPTGPLGSIILRSGLVPGLNGPLVIADAPDPAVVDLPEVRQAANSVLQVRGIACGELVTGTAWVVGGGLLLTNAHVVAGHERTFISGGPSFRGLQVDVTAIDRTRDIAVLAVRGAGLPAALQLRADVRHGESAAIIGYPEGGEERIDAARVDRVAEFATEPVGGGTPVETSVLALRGKVRPGNSGGPILDANGRVLGMVVARGVGQRVPTVYGVAAADLSAAVAQGSKRIPVPTGRCLSEADLQSRLAG